MGFLVLGASFGVINTFLFLRLQEMGGGTSLMGVTLMVTILSEFPCFWFVDRALSAIGDLGIVCVGLCAYMARLAWYGCLGLHINAFDGFVLLDDARWVLPAELLHGLTYAWIKASIAVFAHRLSGDELAAFGQGFLSAIFNGIGQGMGGVI